MYACVFFVKQKTAYEMRISDWSSDVCSSDLARSIPKQDRLDEIAEALGIDHVRAFLAVEIFESVEAYNEPATKLLALFIPWLADTLSSDDCQLDDDLRD